MVHFHMNAHIFLAESTAYINNETNWPVIDLKYFILIFKQNYANLSKVYFGSYVLTVQSCCLRHGLSQCS